MTTGSADGIVITLVHADACHFCADAEAALEGLARQYPLQVIRVEADSAEGQDLIRRHRPAMNPLVLVDNAFFSHGRLPRRKLQNLLARRYGTTSAAAERVG